MIYQFTGVDTHIDFGFGVTGDAYFNSAKVLTENQSKIQGLSQIEMPTNYLYRHSIELYLKSLIIILHKKLELPYDTEPFNTTKPKILVKEKWLSLSNCHWIDELYNYWLNELLLKHNTRIKSLDKKDGHWEEEKDISSLIPLIANYDRDSTYFRYPVTKNSNLDLKKYTMQKLAPNKALSNNPKNKNRIVLLLKNDNDEIVGGFEKSEDILKEVTEALKKISEYFNCIHVMTRATLCESY